MRDIESKIIRHFIRAATAAGFHLHSCSDGEERQRVRTEREAFEVIDSVDQSWLYFSKEGHKNEVLVIILGNGIDCLSDMSAGRDDWDAVVTESTRYVNSLS
jgi:hypothetical protein